MESRVKKIMAEIFDVSEKEINENSSMDTIEVWDSLNHLRLVIALEQEFHIKLTNPADSIGMNSYKAIVKILKRRKTNETKPIGRR